MALVDELRDLFAQWGLASLAEWLVAQEVAGQTPEQIVTDLRNRPEYKARFPAMDALRKYATAHNMPMISEAQYLQMEDSYRKVLQNSGLPPGMFDDAGDFAKLIEGGIDPLEVAERVAAARVAVDQTDPYVRSQLQSIYGISSTDLMAYSLDPQRNSDYIRRIATTATLAGLSERAGMAADRGSWERYAQDAINQRLDQQELTTAVSAAARLSTQQRRLASIEGEQFGTTDAFDVAIEKDAKKILKSEQRAAREKARFAGSQGTGPSSMRGAGL